MTRELVERLPEAERIWILPQVANDLTKRPRYGYFTEYVRADALESQSQELARLRGVLEWYAEQVEGCNRYGNGGDVCRNRLAKDLGERARAALSGEV